MPNDHIQNILAEKIKEFERNFILIERPDYMQIADLTVRGLDGNFYRLKQVNPESSLTSTYTAGYEAGLAAAEKCVPEGDQSGDEFDGGFRCCRNLTLAAINALRK